MLDTDIWVRFCAEAINARRAAAVTTFEGKESDLEDAVIDFPNEVYPVAVKHVRRLPSTHSKPSSPIHPSPSGTVFAPRRHITFRRARARNTHNLRGSSFVLPRPPFRERLSRASSRTTVALRLDMKIRARHGHDYQFETTLRKGKMVVLELIGGTSRSAADVSPTKVDRPLAVLIPPP
ncbi:uncharacterized protein ARMOST_12304 [Armillaria ostoyae]|uniref:Uncharacterized protein n=1 Tax=Armillaria ostoyae TaxID=47428 RepID=A0A284RJI7_ARMOS|nr:uncharacterized protein ARMOST_12304 [Armillaria ostoyae]